MLKLVTNAVIIDYEGEEVIGSIAVNIEKVLYVVPSTYQKGYCDLVLEDPTDEAVRFIVKATVEEVLAQLQ